MTIKFARSKILNDTWRVWIEESPQAQAVGNSLNEAIGALVRKYPLAFEVDRIEEVK